MSFSSPFADAFATLIGWSLIHSLWLGTAIVACAEILASLLRKAPAQRRHVVLLLALLSIPVGAISCAKLLQSDRTAPMVADIQPASRAIDASRSAVAEIGGEPARVVARGSAPEAGAPERRINERRPAGQPGPVGVRPDATRPNATRWIDLARCTTAWIPWIVWAWMTGVAILSVRLLLGCVSLNRLSSSGTSPVSEEIACLVARISSRIALSRTVRVVESTLAEVPATIGFFRPVVLLPFSTLTSLSAKELESILAHELAHIHRGDFIVNLLQVIIEVLLFYHPAVWWLSRRIRQEREHACDDMAIRVTGDRLQYARALTAVAEGALQNRLAVAANGGPFPKRIHRILGRRDVPQSSWLRVISAGILGTILVGGTLALVQPAESTASTPTTDTQDASATGQQIKPISGTILGPRGKPLSGVTVYLRRRPFRYHEGPVELSQLTTGSDGRFEFRDIETPDFSTKYQKNLFPLDVIATKPGFSIRWRRLSNSQTDISIQLKKESLFAGVLKDDAGVPVPNATVRVGNLMSLNTITQINVAGGHTPSTNGDSFLDISESVAEISATTDRQGRFELRGLPNRVGIILHVDDRRFVQTQWYAATTDEELPQIPAGKMVIPPRAKTVDQIMQQRVYAELVPIHKSRDQLEITRGVQLQFLVLSAATGEPVRGVTITASGGPFAATSAETSTDRNGRGDLTRLAPYEELTLKVLPPDTADLLGWSGSMALSSDLRVDREIRLQRGALIRGQVIDADSRKGVPDAAVSFIPQTEDSPRPIPPRVTTDPAGTFRLVVPEVPGRVVLSRAPTGYVLPPKAANHEVGPEKATQVTPSLGKPIEGLAIEIERQPALPFEFVTADGTPTAATVDLRVFSSSNSYFSSTEKVDESGKLDVGRLVRGSQAPTAIQILARSADDRLAAYFRSKDISGLQGEEAHAIVMRPVAAVQGRVVDKETGAPIAGAKVSLSVMYTETGGQGLGGYTCDNEGRYEFDRLVPGMRHSVGARAEDYAALNSIHNRFMANEGQTHTVDLSLIPKKPKPIADLEPVQAPSVSDLSPDKAYNTLVSEYAKADQAYDELLEKHRSGNITDQIVALREPTPVYAAALMTLANSDRGSATELKALKWICKASLVAGTADRYRHLKAEAAARLLADYHDRSEIADVVSNIIYASADRYSAAERLMKSPHHEVQGRACLTGANVLAQAYLDPYRGGHDELRERAIELYQKVIDDYSDLSHWDKKSIARLAENKLFELKDLQFGAVAPEIVGVDLAGQPMKLSEFRGKVVVIHYWSSGIGFGRLKSIAKEYQGKPLVIIGVNTDKDRDKAIAVAQEQGLAIRHWYDPDRTIHARWSGSWPNTHVIGHDGEILYLGQRKSRTPLEDVLDKAVAEAAAKP